MTAYEIQLQYVIQDKIQSETKPEIFFLTNFFLSGKNFYQKKNVRKKILRFCLGLNFVSDFQCAFFELSWTNRC